MRGFRFLLVAVLVAIGIGIGIEAANTANGPKESFKSAETSLSAFPAVQVDLAVLLPASARVPKSDVKPVDSADLRIALATVDGAPIAGQPQSDLDAEVTVLDEGLDLGEVRVVAGRSIFLRVNLASVARLSFVTAADRSTLETDDALFGETWFAIPQQLISGLEKQEGSSGVAAGLVPKGGHYSAQQQAQLNGAATRLENDLLNIVRFGSTSTAAGHGSTATVAIGPALKIAINDLVPEVGRLDPTAAKGLSLGSVSSLEQQAVKTPGTITATVVDDGSGTLTQASLQINAEGQSGSVIAQVRHPSLHIGRPSGARVLPPTILAPIERAITARGLD